MQARVLLIDDDVDLCSLLQEFLNSEGFQVSFVHNGLDGVSKALSQNSDIIVLDSMLPGIGGMEVLRRVRTQSRVPIIMLTANVSESDRILGLEVGADDYMHKPFNPRELAVRIRAIRRRVDQVSVTRRGTTTVGDLSIDEEKRLVLCSTREVKLTSVEFDLLARIAQEPGRVFKRSSLTEEVLNRKFLPYERSIDVHMSNLRAKLGSHPDGSERIQSVRSVGYAYCLAQSIPEPHDR